MRMFDPIIGGEDSGGLSIQGHIPEKDGILANLLILEAMAAKGKSLIELQKELLEIVQARFFNELVNLKLENQEQLQASLEKAKEIKEICGFKVVKTDTKDGIKHYLEDTTSWILIRPADRAAFEDLY